MINTFYECCLVIFLWFPKLFRFLSFSFYHHCNSHIRIFPVRQTDLFDILILVFRSCCASICFSFRFVFLIRYKQINVSLKIALTTKKTIYIFDDEMKLIFLLFILRFIFHIMSRNLFFCFLSTFLFLIFYSFHSVLIHLEYSISQNTFCFGCFILHIWMLPTFDTIKYALN